MKDRGILKIFVMILKNILQVLILLAGSCILVSGEQGVLTPCLQQYVDCILRTPAANNLHCSKHPSAEKFNFETRKFWAHRINILTIGWQNLNPLSQRNATLAPQARQARASGENLNYVTLAPLAKEAKCWNFELLAESLVWYPGKIIESEQFTSHTYSYEEQTLDTAE